MKKILTFGKGFCFALNLFLFLRYNFKNFKNFFLLVLFVFTFQNFTNYYCFFFKNVFSFGFVCFYVTKFYNLLLCFSKSIFLCYLLCVRYEFRIFVFVCVISSKDKVIIRMDQYFAGNIKRLINRCSKKHHYCSIQTPIIKICCTHITLIV